MKRLYVTLGFVLALSASGNAVDWLSPGGVGISPNAVTHTDAYTSKTLSWFAGLVNAVTHSDAYTSKTVSWFADSDWVTSGSTDWATSPGAAVYHVGSAAQNTNLNVHGEVTVGDGGSSKGLNVISGDIIAGGGSMLIAGDVDVAGTVDTVDLTVTNEARTSAGIMVTDAGGLEYQLPSTSGTIGQVLKQAAAGQVTWQAETGGDTDWIEELDGDMTTTATNVLMPDLGTLAIGDQSSTGTYLVHIKDSGTTGVYIAEPTTITETLTVPMVVINGAGTHLIYRDANNYWSSGGALKTYSSIQTGLIYGTVYHSVANADFVGQVTNNAYAIRFKNAVADLLTIAGNSGDTKVTSGSFTTVQRNYQTSMTAVATSATATSQYECWVVTANVNFELVNPAAGGVEVGQHFIVIATDPSGCTLVSHNDTDIINGAASKAVAQWEQAHCITDGTNWYVAMAKP